jgi:hypothetical protein
METADVARPRSVFVMGTMEIVSVTKLELVFAMETTAYATEAPLPN